MNNQIHIGRLKFWIEEEVLFCKVQNNDDGKNFATNPVRDYIKAISSLSNGNYYPLLVDLRDANRDYTLSEVRTLAKNTEIQSVILSKSFVVSSTFMRFSLMLFHGIGNPIIPNKFFKNLESAVNYCIGINQGFNARS